MITNKQIIYTLSPELKSGFFSPDSNPSDFLFFDIETTGLSPKNSRVFLIGLLFQREDAQDFELCQFLSEHSDDTSESLLLKEFCRIASSKKYLVHFNGASFDVPYLANRCKALQIPQTFSDMPQIDLYRELLRMPCFFRQMPGHRQKDFENLVSYPREDLLSGKEMIKIYQNYVKSPDTQSQKLLLLHNSDDLKGMAALLPLGGLRQLLNREYTIEKAEELTENSPEGTPLRKLLFTLSMKHSVCAALSAALPFCYITVLNTTAKIKMPLYQGTLKYFYPDYQNYYYLPYEDEAVHKSIALYLDKSRRQKAKAHNCCKKVSGCFVYAPGSPNLPLLQEDYHAKEKYALWPLENTSQETLLSYVHGILKTAITKK